MQAIRAHNTPNSPTSPRANKFVTPKASDANHGRRADEHRQPFLHREAITGNTTGKEEPTDTNGPPTTSISEQSPLRTRDPERLSINYGGTSYSDARKVKSDSPSRRRHKAPSLRLPDPALDLESNPGSARGVLEDDIDAACSLDLGRISSSRKDTNYKGRVSLPSQQDESLVSRLSSFFGPARQVNRPSVKSLISRLPEIFSRYNSSKHSLHEDIQLEAFREYERRQAEFFQFLDLEFQKIQTFYCEKEEEALERLSVLKNQLSFLRTLHRNEIRQNGQRRKERFLGLNPRFRAEADVTLEHNIRAAHTRAGPLLKIVKQSAPERSSAPRRHLVNSENVDSSASATHATGLYSRSDYVRSTGAADIPYKVAKQKLKFALVEYYRSLELLKSYALLNGIAFKKITKKYIKTIKMEPAYWHMLHKVNKAHFVNSNTIEALMRTTEDLYARDFGKGNRKVAVEKLKSKSAKRGNFGGSIFRNGIFTAAGFILGIEGLVEGIGFLYDPDETFARNTSLLLQVQSSLPHQSWCNLLICT